MADESSIPCNIWRFFDGKAGHRNQILGLTDAMGRITPTHCFDVDVSGSLRGIRSWLPGRMRSLEQFPAPSLLIGAGHATHWPILAARRRYGGRAVVLMKPSLPLFLFDLCLIPAADRLKRIPSNVILTEGALNRIRPSDSLDERCGLILIGGPSEHFGWSDQAILSQVKAVTERHPDIQWTLTTSRRTPASFLGAWHSSGRRGQLVPVDQTGPDWLPEKLRSAATVWVTNESVSMIYEALTSGASVGILTLPKSRNSRVTRGIDSLVARNLVTPFDHWQQSAVVRRATQTLNEASRCAELVKHRLLPCAPESPQSTRRVA
jgi:mitochondrial fission protein ELM1